MQTASVPTGYTAIGSSDGDQEFVGSSSLTADQYLRPQRPLGASVRRPFSYLLPTNAPNDATSIASNNTSHSTDDLLREQNLAIRYRFFNRLDPGGGRLVS
ncbi:unnamed protein product [Anisakis simplex]|uniref:TonB_dep_Rec domain-containing protein n=1 Tax=Anisakis simplex TaxID=6269 RepID=A0A0M3J8I7_ANISI|nr:unnamed protein product [Anisakis simplex]